MGKHFMLSRGEMLPMVLGRRTLTATGGCLQENVKGSGRGWRAEAKVPPSTCPASTYFFFLPHSLPQAQTLVSSLLLRTRSKSLSLILKNWPQQALPCISTLESPLCVTHLLSASPGPHSVSLHWELDWEISSNSQGWWLPGWSWPTGGRQEI